jgi:hypothetical protein
MASDLDLARGIHDLGLFGLHGVAKPLWAAWPVTARDIRDSIWSDALQDRPEALCKWMTILSGAIWDAPLPDPVMFSVARGLQLMVLWTTDPLISAACILARGMASLVGGL